MKERLLNAGKLPPALEARLALVYDCTPLPAAGPERAAFLQAHGGEFEVLVTSSAVGADAALIDALPKLRVISNFGVGLDKLAVAHAQQRGIAVGHTPDVLNDCVADIAFGLLIDIARGMSQADRFVRAGTWAQGKPFPLARKVTGAKLGIVGLGRIGRAIAKRSTGFEMEVRYHSRRPVADVPWAHEPSLANLARWCDYLVIITSGGPETQHLVNAEILDALGPDGFIINVARGSVIDEVALVQALQDKRIAGAGLDVFDREPHVPPALFGLDNVVLLPHIASGTRETRQAMADLVFDNLQSFFDSGVPLRAAPQA